MTIPGEEENFQGEIGESSRAGIGRRGPFVSVDRKLRFVVPSELLRWLPRCVRRAGPAMGVSARAREEIEIRVCDDHEISDLNRRFLGNKGATDVLSFPATDAGDGAGSIVLAWPFVVRQAAAHGDLRGEIGLLLVHALAHLLGHDHRTRAQARRMLTLERRGLSALGLPDRPRPYGDGGLR